MPILFSKSFNGIELLKVNGDPNGIPGSVGSLALDISSNLKYKCIGNSVWNPIIPWGPNANGPAGLYPSSFTPEKFGAKGDGTTSVVVLMCEFNGNSIIKKDGINLLG